MKKLIAILLTMVMFACLPVEAQSVYEHYSENANTKHAKKMMKVFEDIAENKWESASKRLQDMEEKYEKMKAKNPDDADAMMEALRPLPDLGHVLLDIAPRAEGEEVDNNKVWTAYDKVKRMEKHKRQIDGFLSMMDENPLQFSEVVDKIESLLHGEVAAQRTVAAYEKLIGVLRKNSRIKDKLNRECEQLWYEEVMGSEDVERCAKYLERFTKNVNSEHYKEVSAYRDKLAYAAAPSTEQGMRQFLKDYPQSRMADEAWKRLYEYAFQGLEHTEKAYRQYVMEFPKSPRLEEARDSMNACAWQETEKEGTFKAYDTFCRNFAQAKNIGEAKAKRIAAGRKEFARLDAVNIPEDLLQDSIIANFLRSKKYNIYSRQMYSIHDERVDTVIENITTSKGGTHRRVYIFNSDGMIARDIQSEKLTTEYEYGEESGTGFYLAMTNSSGGKMLSYTPRFAPNGQLLELKASDGSRETYDYMEEESAFVHSFFPKAAKVAAVKRRYAHGRLVETNRGAERTTYEYNEQGDVVRQVTNSGSKVLSLTTFEYKYNDHGCWTECCQKAVDGSIQERKTRTYKTSTAGK